MNNEEQIDKLKNNLKKSDSFLAVGFAMMYVAIGILTGVLIMYFSHKEIYNHVNHCQEQELDSLSK